MKKKWYRTNFMKTILVVLVCASMALSAMCGGLLLYMAGKGFNPFVSHSSALSGYLESERFLDTLYNSAASILAAVQRDNILAGMGENPVIDLKEVGDNKSGKNTSGLAYSAADLKEWAQHSWDFAPVYDTGKNIIVCEKSDGTRKYFYYEDFAKEIENGSLCFTFKPGYTEDYNTTKEELTGTVLSMLNYGNLPEAAYDWGSSEWLSTLTDSDGNELYQTFYNYTGNCISEEYSPVGADSLLDILNKNSYWNTRIDEAFLALNNALEMVASATLDTEEDVLSRYEAENTNLSYFYMDSKTGEAHTNQSATEAQAVKKAADSKAYIIFRPKLSDCETNLAGTKEYRSHDFYLTLEEWHHYIKNNAPDEDFVFAVSVDTDFPVTDSFAAGFTQYKLFKEQAKSALAGLAVSLLLLLAGAIWLTLIAGRRSGDEEVHLCFFDYWFTEISAGLVAGIWACPFFVLGSWLSPVGLSDMNADGFLKAFCTMTLLAGLYTALLFFTGYLSLVRRIKAKRLWKGSLLHWLLCRLRGLFRRVRDFLSLYASNTGSKIKLTLAMGAFLFFQFFLVFGAFCVIDRTPMALFFLLLVFVMDAALLAFGIKKAAGRERILEGLKRISGGELQYKIPLDGLTGEQYTMSECINNIGSGLDAAVENSLKNERMKTELITNVSHDIKTPLTSIINYVDLLKRENFTDEKICGYLNILEEKAHRLKVLTEDVVEASKASTGNISLEMTELNFVEMVHQVIGEFEEKFQEKRLTMMVHFTDEPSVIYADGQRMWRILANIFTNVSKYAMEGTRVYAEVRNENQKVLFSLKNISAQPLNISAGELTERFIRGDVSRSTEGSGLGLSIAKSLTELQGGEFNLYLDGDLFKVTITFAARP